MKCGKCKKEGVTNEHVRRCYGLRPRQTSNATVDIDRYPKANEVRAREDARQQAERERKWAARKRNSEAEREQKQKTKRKREEKRLERARQEAAWFAAWKAARAKEGLPLYPAPYEDNAEFDQQRKASKCNACGMVPDINGGCRCS